MMKHHKVGHDFAPEEITVSVDLSLEELEEKKIAMADVTNEILDWKDKLKEASKSIKETIKSLERSLMLPLRSEIKDGRKLVTITTYPSPSIERGVIEYVDEHGAIRKTVKMTLEQRRDLLGENESISYKQTQVSDRTGTNN